MKKSSTKVHYEGDSEGKQILFYLRITCEDRSGHRFHWASKSQQSRFYLRLHHRQKTSISTTKHPNFRGAHLTSEVVYNNLMSEGMFLRQP